jgi:hypothetical protein
VTSQSGEAHSSKVQNLNYKLTYGIHEDFLPIFCTLWIEPGKLGRELRNGYRWIYYSYRGITKVTIKDSDIHVDS